MSNLRKDNVIGDHTSDSWYSVVCAYDPSKERKQPMLLLRLTRSVLLTFVGVKLADLGLKLNDIHKVLSGCYVITLALYLVPQRTKLHQRS